MEKKWNRDEAALKLGVGKGTLDLNAGVLVTMGTIEANYERRPGKSKAERLFTEKDLAAIREYRKSRGLKAKG